MGARAIGTLEAVALAFLEQRTWEQPELARHLGIDTRGLRAVLNKMLGRGWPLVREEDPVVMWSVPRDWFPGGVGFQGKDVQDLLRVVLRSPRSKERERLLARILRASPSNVATPRADAIVSAVMPDDESRWLALVEDAASLRRVASVRYLSHGVIAWRFVSIQRVLAGNPVRFHGWCHRDEKMKTWRLANVVNAKLDAEKAFHPVDSAALDTLERESVGGFHGDDHAIECVYFVRTPEAAWVRNNLPSSHARVEDVPGGIRVRITTTAPLQLARCVVGLGAAARAETHTLKECVREIAEGAMGTFEERSSGARVQ